MSRENSDEKYVLDLIAEILNTDFIWQKTFSSLVGDPGQSGARKCLPLDGYYEKYNLIVEYCEKLHFETVTIMDKRMTVSRVTRGEQRKLYDKRKEDWAISSGYSFLKVCFYHLSHSANGKLIRDRQHDTEILKELFDEADVKY